MRPMSDARFIEQMVERTHDSNIPSSKMRSMIKLRLDVFLCEVGILDANRANLKVLCEIAQFGPIERILG